MRTIERVWKLATRDLPLTARLHVLIEPAARGDVYVLPLDKPHFGMLCDYWWPGESAHPDVAYGMDGRSVVFDMVPEAAPAPLIVSTVRGPVVEAFAKLREGERELSRGALERARDQKVTRAVRVVELYHPIVVTSSSLVEVGPVRPEPLTWCRWEWDHHRQNARPWTDIVTIDGLEQLLENTIDYYEAFFASLKAVAA